ncbi:MAG: PQQ-binding-like beta-propeller repeat protein [Verrucomicrobiae bacterium]|nr:PQQ-binding-like beta-propeller repeat protein [Verrucomicrobiae bacterium]
MKKMFVIAFLMLLLANVGICQTRDPFWVFPVGASVQSSPAIGKDGTIYFGADNGIFYALNSEGKKKWEFVTSGLIVSTPAVASDGTIYIASIDKIVYAINPDGSEKWRIMPGSGIVSSPAIAPDGSIMIGSVFNKLFAISADGFRRWEFPTMGNIISSPAIDSEGNVYFGCMDTNFYALSTNGAAMWTFSAEDRINSSPAIGRDGTLYFGSFDKYVYAVTADGKLRWRFKTDGAVRSSAVIGQNGEVYIGSDDGKLYAISPDGAKLWDFQTKDWVRATPVVAADGSVYFGSYDGNFYAVGKDGKLKWTLKTQGIVSSSPIIDTNGVVYFGSWDKNFYAVKGDSPIAETAWSCFRRNARRTGCEIDDATPKPSIKLTKTETELRIPPRMVESEVRRSEPSSEAKSQPESQKSDSLSMKTMSAVVETTGSRKQDLQVVQKPVANEKGLESGKSAIARPTLKITSPRNGARVSESRVLVEGTARDKIGIKSVQYRLNSTVTGIANGLGKWSVQIPLQEGRNLFEVRCQNEADNFSEWEAITIYFTPSYKIFAEIIGKGRISPEISGKNFDAGAKIRLKAEPASGFNFLCWNGSINEKSPEVEIMVVSNMFLQAIFVQEEKKSDRASQQIAQKETKEAVSGVKTVKKLVEPSSYNALIYSKTDTESIPVGSLQITVNGDLTWKGRLTTFEENLSLEGKFDNRRYSFVSIKQSSKPPFGLALKLSDTNDAQMVYGQITGGGREMNIVGYKQTPLGAFRDVKSGIYTAILAVPDTNTTRIGDGYAKIILDESGNAQISGKLFDGSPFSTSSGLDSNLTMPVFVNMRDGCLAGAIVFTNTQVSDVVGDCFWSRKNADAMLSQRMESVRLIGSYYSDSKTESQFITNTNLVVAFSGGGLESIIANMVYVTPQNKIELKYTDADLNFSLDFRNGIFKGTFVHPVLKKRARFEGVILQKNKWGSGHFICEDKCGLVFVGVENGQTQ